MFRGPHAETANTIRDMLVVGASSGGRAAAAEIVAGLPRELQAAVLIVVHSGLDRDDTLPRRLASAGPIPAVHATDGQRPEPGRIYCARGNRHLIVREGLLRLTRGPKENRFRPAIDPLFRTAARHFGSRVVGVVLTGRLDDGSRGLAAIKARGGVAVQSPDDAEAPEMPRNALLACDADFVVPLREMAPLLVGLVNGAVQPSASRAGAASVDPRGDAETERLANAGDQALTRGERLGTPAAFTCPDCGGVLFERDGDRGRWYRCHVGHIFTPEGLAATQEEEVEMALWSALRSLEEAAAFRQEMSERMLGKGVLSLAEKLSAERLEYEAQAATLRRLILGDGARDVR